MRQLGQLEASVMERMWAADRPLVVREVLENLLQDRQLAYTTVMTVMDNLHKKGLLSRKRQGRAYAYRAIQTREEHTAEMMEAVLGTAGDRTAALLHFVETISADEVAELQAAIDQTADHRSGA